MAKKVGRPKKSRAEEDLELVANWRNRVNAHIDRTLARLSQLEERVGKVEYKVRDARK